MRTVVEIRDDADRAMFIRRLMSKPIRRPWKITAEFADGRTDEQNDLMWPLLRDIARQVEWHGQKLRPEEWKDVLVAALKGQKAVPGIDGGLVMIGAHTSRMSKADFSELIEAIYAFGAEHGVEWSE